MRVALVHDYLKEYGGAERVLEALHEIFPEAPIYTSFSDLDSLGPHKERVKSWDIKTSWFQKFPFHKKLASPMRIFASLMFESFDLKEYDLVISSSAVYFSKAVIKRPDALHISYIHTPPRYLYGYTTSFNYKKNFLVRILGELINHILRLYDFETSQRPDILVANSKNIQSRIKKFYRRESVVIYPPVDISRITNHESRITKKEYFLSVSRLVRGKGVEVIVEACMKLGLPLKIVGTGPELENLKLITHHSSLITFLGEVKDEELGELYGNAKALIVASEDEDFGITAVESQACGTPVIAVKAGGYLETVIDGKTGVFFEEATVESLKKVLQEFDERKFKQGDLIKNAEKFSKERFKKEIIDLIEKNFPKT